MAATKRMMRSACVGLGAAIVATMATSPVRAELGSDKPAAILVFPSLLANTALGVDSIIQVSNASPNQIGVRCVLVNANSHCSNAGGVVPTVCEQHSDCNPSAVTGGVCIPGWQETDFRFELTPHQPIWWRLSEGRNTFPLDGILRVGPNRPDTGLPAINADSAILGAGEDPFFGELKCVQVDPDTDLPRQGTDPENNFAGDLTGEVTVVNTIVIDARTYNAVGLQAIPDANDGDNALALGVEYDGCPSVILLDHFFDEARIAVDDSIVRTVLTLVPCSENFLTQDARRQSTVVQALVFNEFEQRFSAATAVSCAVRVKLSDIGTRPGAGDDATSIFNVNVMGTLTGQTRLRAVDNLGNPTRGDGLLAVAEEFHQLPGGQVLPGEGAANGFTLSSRSAGFNVHHAGVRGRPDTIVLGPEE